MTAITHDLAGLSLVITSIATLLGVVVQIINSFRNSKKIDATHALAQDTFNQTQRVYIPSLKNPTQQHESD